jgi:hypothetical protein
MLLRVALAWVFALPLTIAVATRELYLPLATSMQ